MKARHKDTGEIIELAEEGIISCDGRRFCWYQVELIPEPIDDFKPSLPDNLDEAARKYGHEEPILPEGYNDGDIPFYERWTADAFKTGAEWMAGQGVEVKGKVIMDFSTPADIINRRLIVKLEDALLSIILFIKVVKSASLLGIGRICNSFLPMLIAPPDILSELKTIFSQ